MNQVGQSFIPVVRPAPGQRVYVLRNGRKQGTDEG